MNFISPDYTSQLVSPGTFEAENHWYPKALNATLHPMVDFFLHLSPVRIIERYCHLHPGVDREALSGLLKHKPRYFRWGGADLINVATEKGKREMVVIENNSCPSGQKSMPLMSDHEEMGSYKILIQRTFLPMLKSKNCPEKGGIAVIYDKNIMEASGYAAVIADLTGESVHLVELKDKTAKAVQFEDGMMHVYGADKKWHAIRAAFRYVTQRPWNRIPLETKTRILNPIIACLAGGRNKMVAAKAYDIFNADYEEAGLHINTPETIWDVTKEEVPIYVKMFGGHAVVKIPYSNAGQGVFTITGQKELDDFMAEDYPYNQFIVQSLIGNYHWTSKGKKGRLYHVGTMPNLKGKSYVCDIRLMVCTGKDGISPLCMYGRRAAKHLEDQLTDGSDSWPILGTNLSIKTGEGTWDTDSNRLMLTDRRDFNKLGIGLDDLIEGYIQTIASMIAIDNMAKMLMKRKEGFQQKLFLSLNNDKKLLEEIRQGSGL